MNLHCQLWKDFISLCESLDESHFSRNSELLYGASIGEHLRHSYEFYDCLLRGKKGGVINYDLRNRDRQIETNKTYAIEKMKELVTVLEKPMVEANLKFQSNEIVSEYISSTLHRELLYCLDHAIHHQALIKIGLKELGCAHLVGKNFGVAYSTIRFRELYRSV